MEDRIVRWNKVVLEPNRLDHTAAMKADAQGGPTLSSRALVIVHLAMCDTIFSIARVAAIPGAGPRKLDLLFPSAWSGGISDVEKEVDNESTKQTNICDDNLSAGDFKSLLKHDSLCPVNCKASTPP